MGEPDPARSSSALAGTVLGRYLLERLLGEGGMGVVYAARHQELGRRAAVKVLNDRLARSAEVRARFLREGQAAARIRHPHVVDVYDVGDEGGRAYLVMELLEGEDLRSVMARECPLSTQRAADILLPVFSALAAAHECGVVHRDLKPENVFMTVERGASVPKVLDFGISKLLDADERGAATGTGVLLGTLHYMSPEQARSARNVDARSDQYSAGVMLYECVTGRRPIEAEAIYQVIQRIVQGDFAPPRQHVPELPASFESLVLKAMATDPEQRFPDVRALGRALLEFASERVRANYAEEFSGSAAPSAPDPAPSPKRELELATTLRQSVHEREARRPALRRRVLGAPVLAGLLLSGGIVAALGWRIAQPARLETAPAAANSAGTPNAAPSVSPIAIVDLPIAGTKNVEARGAYAQALGDLRRADYQRAYQRLHTAVAKDPNFALAQLRLAHVEALRRELVESKKRLRWLVDHESELDERHRAYLRGVETLHTSDPPDYRSATAHFEAARQRWPGDAEFHFMLSGTYERMFEVDKSLAAAHRAIEIDPEYADALQMVGRLLMRRGETDAATGYLDRCVAARSVDCLFDRQRMRARAGRCDDVIADAKLIDARGGMGSLHWVYAASALLSQGEKLEAARTFLERGERQANSAWARWFVRSAELRFKVLLGRFDEIQETNDLDKDATSFEELADLVTLRVLARAEAGQAAAAVAVGERFLSERHAAAGGFHLQPTEDPSPLFWHFLHGAGKISGPELTERLERWQGAQRAIGFDAGPIWFQSQALPAGTPAEATRALASKPKQFVVPQVHDEHLGWDVLGRLYRLAGDQASARQQLGQATKSCTLLLYPFAHVHAHAELGASYETSEDRERACASYRQVLRWWNTAKPRSLTAEHARARIRALKCPAPTP